MKIFDLTEDTVPSIAQAHYILSLNVSYLKIYWHTKLR